VVVVQDFIGASHQDGVAHFQCFGALVDGEVVVEKIVAEFLQRSQPQITQVLGQYGTGTVRKHFIRKPGQHLRNSLFICFGPYLA
jgi:hypothetical protein